NNGAAFTGSTFTRILSGVTTLAGSAAAQNLSLEGATLDGAGTLIVSGTLNWTAGTMAGSGVTQILNGGTFNISGSFTIQNDLACGVGGGAGSIFNNSGTFLKSAGAGTTTFAVTFNNTGSASAVSGSILF